MLKPILHSWDDWKTRVPCRKPPKERVATVKDYITMDESASVSNPEIMKTIELDDDYNDNNNVNNDDIILREENERLKQLEDTLKQNKILIESIIWDKV